MQLSKQSLRNSIKTKRLREERSAQRSATQSIIHKMWNQPWLTQARSVAGYWPVRGEVNLLPLLHKLHRCKVTTLLPRVDFATNSLRFIVWNPKSHMIKNAFGIPEPVGLEIATTEIHVVCLPLVAFDSHLNRLGMGGGFYDRTFAASKWDGIHKPTLCGAAYEYQHVEHIDACSWDVRLDYVITPRQLLHRTS